MRGESTSANTGKPITFNVIINDLKVEEKAHSDANNNIPPTSAKMPTSHEMGFIAYFKEAAVRERDVVKKKLDGYKADLSEIYHSRIIEDLKGLPGKLSTANHNSRQKSERILKGLKKEASARKMALKKFAVDNELNREPQPQHNPMQVTFWIMSIVMLETALNATFFAVGSDRGLLGGAIQAFVISFLNVMLAWFLGRLCIPQFNSVHPDRKYIAMACAGMLVLGVFMLNMFAGHYRSALEEDAFKAVLMAVESFSANIFSIKSAQGWLLTAVGSVAFTGLTTKIFMSDDPYPGYGKVHRLYLRAQDEWIAKQKEFTDEIIANYDGIETERAQKTDRLTQLEIGYGVLLDKLKRNAEQYKTSLGSLETTCNKVVNHYRARIRFYRGEDYTSPGYFSEEVSLSACDFEIDLDLDKEEAHMAELIERFEEYRREDSARIKTELSDMHNQEMDKLNGFFGNA